MADDVQVAATHPTSRWLPLTSIAIDRERGLMTAGEQFGALWLWSEASVAEAPAIADVTAAITSVAFLSDGRVAAVHQNEAIAIWTIGRPTPDKVIKLDNLSFSRVAALTGDIRAAIPLSDKTMLVLSGDDLRETRVPADSMPLDQWGLTAAPAANSAFISYSDGTIRRRDLGAGGEGTIVFDASQPICGVGPTTDNNGSRSLDVSADGKWLAATRSDSAVVVHNLADPAKPLCLTLPAPESKTVAFSPDSTKLAILSATDRLFVFDLARPDTAIIYDAPGVPDNSPLAIAAGSARTTSWLDWRDDRTRAIATTAGAIEFVVLDPSSWRARVDTLAFTP
jgi:WD40 repeat protein